MIKLVILQTHSDGAAANAYRYFRIARALSLGLSHSLAHAEKLFPKASSQLVGRTPAGKSPARKAFTAQHARRGSAGCYLTAPVGGTHYSKRCGHAASPIPDRWFAGIGFSRHCDDVHGACAHAHRYRREVGMYVDVRRSKSRRHHRHAKYASKIVRRKIVQAQECSQCETCDVRSKQTGEQQECRLSD